MTLGAEEVNTKSMLKAGLWIVTAAIFMAASGCALPGYDAGAVDGDTWYKFGKNDATATYDEKLSDETVVDYEPVVVQITPRLISHLNSQSAKQKLSPEVEKLTQPEDSVNYVAGPGDVLQIIVFGHPELTNPGGTSSNSSSGGGSADAGASGFIQGQLVNADGSFYYPYVGKIQAAGKTLSQLRHTISKGLSNYIRDPQVDVRVRQFRSQRVYVSGDIAQPCTVPITDINLTVVQALSQCPSLSSKEGGGVGVQNVRLIRGDTSALVNLNNIYAAGRAIPLKPDDRLLVDDTANRVFMVGEFDEQTALPYSTGGMSLNDAIADAGGLSLSTANASNLYVIRGFVNGRSTDGGVKTTMRPHVYRLDASNPTSLLLANQFKLQPRDVVFAAPASFVNFNRALALVTPSLNQLFQTLYLFDRFDN